jgi:hypothetical protein
MFLFVTLSITTICYKFHYAECRYAMCCYAEFHCAECGYAERSVSFIIMLNVIMLSVVAPWISSFLYKNYDFQQNLTKEVNCTEPSPSAGIPC